MAKNTGNGGGGGNGRGVNRLLNQSSRDYSGRPDKPLPKSPATGGADPADNPNTPKARYTAVEDIPILNNPKVKLSQSGDRDQVIEMLHRIQGFTKPQIVDAKALDNYVASGERELFRGIRGAQAKEWSQNFKDGVLFGGTGSFGNGTYTTTNAAAAKGYLRGAQDAAIMRMTLKSDARVADYTTLRKEMMADHAKYSKGKTGEDLARVNAIYKDVGRYGIAKGYDAVDVSLKVEGKTVENYVVVLNYSSVRVQKTDVDPKGIK